MVIVGAAGALLWGRMGRLCLVISSDSFFSFFGSLLGVLAGGLAVLEVHISQLTSFAPWIVIGAVRISRKIGIDHEVEVMTSVPTKNWEELERIICFYYGTYLICTSLLTDCLYMAILDSRYV